MEKDRVQHAQPTERFFDLPPLLGKPVWQPGKEVLQEINIEPLMDKTIINRIVKNANDFFRNPENPMAEWFQNSIEKYSKTQNIEESTVFNSFMDGFDDYVHRSFFVIKKTNQSPYSLEGRERFAKMTQCYQHDFMDLLETAQHMNVSPSVALDLSSRAHLIDSKQLRDINEMNRHTETFKPDELAKILIRHQKVAGEYFKKCLERVIMLRDKEPAYAKLDSSIITHTVIEFDIVFRDQLNFYLEQSREARDLIVDIDDQSLFDSIYRSRINASILDKSGKIVVNRPSNLVEEYNAAKVLVRNHQKSNPLLSKSDVIRAMIRTSGNLDKEFDKIKEEKKKKNVEMAGRFKSKYPEFDNDFLLRVVEVHGDDTGMTIISIKKEIEVMSERVSVNGLKKDQLQRAYSQIYRNGYARVINFLRYAQFLDDSVRHLEQQFPQFRKEDIIEIACYNPISGLRNDDEIYNHTDLDKPLRHLVKMVEKAKVDFEDLPDWGIAKCIIRSSNAQKYVLNSDVLINPLQEPEILKNLFGLRNDLKKLKESQVKK